MESSKLERVGEGEVSGALVKDEVDHGPLIAVDLGFAPDEAANLTMRADLMAQLRLTIEKRKWTQAEAAKNLGVSQSRISDLIRGKWDKFSLDMLVTLATRAGSQCRLKLAA